MIAELGSEHAYLLLNLLLVACVFLCLKFVELFARSGKPLPSLGFVAGGALAFGFALIVDWTKYFGLLTNLSSALPGLGALCAIAAIDSDERRARLLVPLALLLAALSFLAKEDFALPILVATTCMAILHRSRRWAAMTGAVAILFAAAVLFNRIVGSVFVSGTRSPSDPYFVDLSPSSLASSLGRMLLASTHGRMVVVAALAAVVVAIAVNRRDRRPRLQARRADRARAVVAGAEFDLPESRVRLLRVRSDRDAVGDAGRGVLRRFGATE